MGGDAIKLESQPQQTNEPPPETDNVIQIPMQDTQDDIDEQVAALAEKQAACARRASGTPDGILNDALFVTQCKKYAECYEAVSDEHAALLDTVTRKQSQDSFKDEAKAILFMKCIASEVKQPDWGAAVQTRCKEKEFTPALVTVKALNSTDEVIKNHPDKARCFAFLQNEAEAATKKAIEVDKTLAPPKR